jgi:hypothetical protein
MLQPEQNRLNSRLLQLPGEIRNHIFSYTIFPLLSSLTVAHGTEHRRFVTNILSLGIFRACHQLRHEALSFLAATKRFEILGTDAACAFLDCLGPAIADVKRIAVAQPIVEDAPMSSRQIDTFFYFLGKATSLQYFKLEAGSVGTPLVWTKENVGADWVFLERTLAFVKNKDEIRFHWKAGAYDMRARTGLDRGHRIAGIKELFGAWHQSDSKELVYLF